MGRKSRVPYKTKAQQSRTLQNKKRDITDAECNFTRGHANTEFTKGLSSPLACSKPSTGIRKEENQTGTCCY